MPWGDGTPLLGARDIDFLRGLYLLNLEDPENPATQSRVGEHMGQDVAETPVRVLTLLKEDLIEEVGVARSRDDFPNQYTDLPLRVTAAGRAFIEPRV